MAAQEESGSSDKPTWALVLRRTDADPARVVGGLSLALRLALDAQAAGARGIVLEAGVSKELLHDQRLKLPVIDAPEAHLALVSAPASYLMPRQLLSRLADGGLPAPGQTRDLVAEPLHARVPYGFEPMDIRDAATARQGERALFRALRKPQDGWTSRHLNRYISLSISRLLVRTPLTPNQVSIGILAVGLAGAVLATRGDYLSLLAAATLFQAQSVLDGCDGEMSRVTHRGSLAGQWLDTVGDDLTNYGFFAGAAIGLYQTTSHWAYLLAGGVTVLCGVTVSAIEYRYLIRIGSGDLLQYPLSAQSTAADGGLYSKIAPLFKRDTFVFLTWIAALFSLVGPMLFVFAAGAVGILMGVLTAELRMARERRQGATP